MGGSITATPPTPAPGRSPSYQRADGAIPEHAGPSEQVGQPRPGSRTGRPPASCEGTFAPAMRQPEDHDTESSSINGNAGRLAGAGSGRSCGPGPHTFPTRRTLRRCTSPAACSDAGYQDIPQPFRLEPAFLEAIRRRFQRFRHAPAGSGGNRRDTASMRTSDFRVPLAEGGAPPSGD